MMPSGGGCSYCLRKVGAGSYGLGRVVFHARVEPGQAVACTDGVHLVYSPHRIQPGTRVRKLRARLIDTGHLVASAARRLRCALSGHDMLLHYEPDRLSLRCWNCGARTAGWRVDRPVARQHGAMRAATGGRVSARHAPAAVRRPDAA
jgi:hypothetical protein